MSSSSSDGSSGSALVSTGSLAGAGTVARRGVLSSVGLVVAPFWGVGELEELIFGELIDYWVLCECFVARRL